MSFILDALKKSESERQRQSGPGVFQPRIASPRARFPLWAIALGLLLGVNLLVLLWVMTRPDPAPETTVATPAAAAPAPAAAAAPAPASAPAAATPGAAAGTRFNPPLIVDPTLSDDGAVPQGAPAGSASTPAGAPFNPNDYVPAQPGPAAANPPAAAPRDVAATAGAAPNYATREALVARGQNVPEVALSLHVYDADPARRFVFVNGQRGRDGETLPNGLRIEQILPEGAVLSWNGNRFFAPLQ